MALIPGFAAYNGAVDINTEPEKPKLKKNRKGGGFQTMGLSYNVLKGVTKRGYQQPTPIQRKTIPLALEGRDIVAMARTGSGKTACFLIPMFEKLKARSAKAGARALIFSPTRELALQTLKFIKELGSFTDLKAAVVLGGDSMDDQFSALHGNPDVIVATPGRFLHVCLEMELKLQSIEYVVFDEADRLFEMGLAEQLTEIIHRLPDARQTLLFSATLPKLLVEFAKVGLTDPVLLRLDVESKIPEELKLEFIIVRPEERVAGLLVLLRNCLEEKQQTVVFAATRHHVEYLHLILDKMKIPNTYIYSNLDPSARKIHAAMFSTGKVPVLVVTDVAARGIDIPQLDNVINFNFPAKSKLFVHRVGRVARAGRTGTAYSLIAPDEYAFLLDLHLFLGRPLKFHANGAVGAVPRTVIEEAYAGLVTLHSNSVDLVNLKRVCENAYQQYLRSRPAASTDSNRRVKSMPFSTCANHRMFGTDDEDQEDLLRKMRNYRPNGTIFEICGKNKSQEYQAMKQKRVFHKEKISHHRDKLEEIEPTQDLKPVTTPIDTKEFAGVFHQVIVPKKRKLEEIYKKDKRRKLEKDEYFIPYAPKDRHTEEGLAVGNFQREASQFQLDFVQDSDKAVNQKKWDRKKKKMVGVADRKAGKIRTESGVWIPATYKTNRYSEWKEKSKIDNNNEEDEDGPGKKIEQNTRWAKHNRKMNEKQRRSELKSTDQIMKARKLAEKKKKKNKQKRGKKRK